MQTLTLARVFVSNGLRLQDPDPSMTPSDVLAFYTQDFPHLGNAQVGPGVERNGELEFAIVDEPVRTKG